MDHLFPFDLLIGVVQRGTIIIFYQMIPLCE